ncbi:MAG: family 10 glycosylhydrolase [Cyanobacteria bacterium J06621_12]
MPISVKVLPQSTFLASFRIKQSLNGLAKLVPIMFVGAVLFPPTAAASNLRRHKDRASSESTAVSQRLLRAEPKAQSFALQDDGALAPQTTKPALTVGQRLDSELVITSGEARLMTQELTGLIDRFKATLLTVDASESNIDISTESLVKQLIESDTITRKDNNKSTSSKYQNSHLALHLASTGLQKFNYLVKQQRYDAARAEWSAAQKVLWSNYPQDKPLAQSEVRAMWFDRGTIVKAKSEADLIDIFDRMAIAGINTIFFETLNSSYTIYPSEVAPVQNPLVKGWDPLQAAVKLAHERDMELHAWVWTFAAVNKRHNTILDLPRHHLGPVLSQRPEWAMTDHQGSRFHYSSGKVFLDPANPEVRGYLQALIGEIAQNYDVDGIHLDYIRYPFQSPTGKLTYGYGAAAREKFQHETGYDPVDLNPYHPLWSKWIEFRTEQVDTFVFEVSQQLKQIDPELILSTAVFPMPRRDRLNKIQQGWEKWVSKEWIDLLVPMTYAQDTERLNSLASPLLREFRQGKALLLPGIRLLNMSDVVALDQMQLLRGLSTEGYSLFAAENLNSSLIDVFNRTQGNKITTSQLPHRQPFQASLSRYLSLQQEWNFFIADNPGEVDAKIMLEWGKQADRLRRELQEFAAEPSSSNLFSVQVTLSSLRKQFPYWMSRTKSIDRYQAQVWQNRLDTLDRLVSYGRRKRLRN